MMNYNNDYIINLLTDREKELKNNNFDAIVDIMYRSTHDESFYWELYRFCLQELGIDILTYMTKLPKDFFEYFEIASIAIPENIKTISRQIRCGAIKNLVINSSAMLPASCFEENSVESVTINGDIKRIPSHCFYHCNKLQKVVLPDSVQEIAAYAFPQDNEDLIVVVPYKETNKLRVPRSEIAWYKDHLRHRR